MLTAPRALVAAAALLVLASGGVGYAASQITGKQIKNGSVTGADIKNKSLTGKDVKDGSLSAVDLAPGVLPPNVTVVARHENTTTNAQNGSLTASCLEDEQAVGGSAGIHSGNIAGLLYFHPGGQPVVANDGSGRVTGWSASWFNGESHNNTYRVTALCIPAP